MLLDVESSQLEHKIVNRSSRKMVLFTLGEINQNHEEGDQLKRHVDHRRQIQRVIYLD